MAYAPGVQSMGGQFIAQGVQQGLASLAQAILGRAEERKRKDDMAEAVKTLQPLIEKMAPGSGINLSKDTPKEAIPQVIQLAGEVGRMQREAPLKSLQVENERLRQRISQQELETAADNAAAAGAAAPFLDPNRSELPDPSAVKTAFDAGQPVPAGRKGPDYVGAMSSYLGKRGQDPRMLAQLGDLAQQQMRGNARGEPGLRNFGKDASGRPVEGLVDAQGNVKYITPPKEAKDVAEPFKIGGKEFFKVGNDILDATGRPVKAETVKPLDPFAAQALYSRYQTVLAEAAPEPKKGMFESKEAAEQRTAQKREQANFLAGQLGFAAPFPAAGTMPEQPEQKPTKAPVTPYRHEDVLAEMKRRGLGR